MVQKEGLERGEGAPVLPLTAAGAGRQGAGARAELSVCFTRTVPSAGEEGQQHPGRSHRRRAAMRRLWHLLGALLISSGHWCLRAGLSPCGAAGAFWGLLNLCCFRYLSNPGKFSTTTNVPRVGEASLGSLPSDGCGSLLVLGRNKATRTCSCTWVTAPGIGMNTGWEMKGLGAA